MKLSVILTSLLFITIVSLNAQQEIKLYNNSPKENNEIQSNESFRDPEFIINISDARMYAYPAKPEKANGVAVVICPGGGYVGISQIKEGAEFAKWFNDLGITAFVLYYRMPNGHSGIPLTDAQTALTIIRERAKEWNIKKVGIMGFSAGGHLASTVGTHFTNKNNRPSFMILAYPVVTMDSTFTHKGSRQNLLGQHPDENLVRLYSNELQVKKNTPPTFIVHARDDKAVPIENSRALAKAIQSKGISCELVEYDKGGHGFGMRKHNIPADNWPEKLEEWLIKQHLIHK